jgi:hypothetical protein
MRHVCEVCVEHCHASHHTVLRETKKRKYYCECGASGKCASLTINGRGALGSNVEKAVEQVLPPNPSSSSSSSSSFSSSSPFHSLSLFSNVMLIFFF